MEPSNYCARIFYSVLSGVTALLIMGNYTPLTAASPAPATAKAAGQSKPASSFGYFTPLGMKGTSTLS
jgi:hypothetical protein